ncbi:Uncharacterised protein [Peptoniphilus indolicus]|uniref:Uncharacterized protein n=1 Tax=Peptoniphilus indolicus TaxID=33030 RepID=A0A379D9N9_9FIRM|nr:Uncharacterised protein [Peptoniphilus indolicus]
MQNATAFPYSRFPKRFMVISSIKKFINAIAIKNIILFIESPTL